MRSTGLASGQPVGHSRRSSARPSATPTHPSAASAHPLATPRARSTSHEKPDDARREAVTLERVNEPSRSPSSSDSSRAPELRIPPRLARGIIAVRLRLPTAKDFGKLYECFDDRVARVPELWESSQIIEQPLLGSIAVGVGQRYRPGFEPKASRIFEIGDTGFLHGAVIGTTGLACLFYDEHLGMGLVALSNPFDGTNRTDFVRFGPMMLGSPSGVESATTRMPC